MKSANPAQKRLKLFLHFAVRSFGTIALTLQNKFNNAFFFNKYTIMAFKFNDDNTAEEIKSGKALVIDFWAEWCGPCKHIAPIVDELAEEYEGKVLIGKYDVEEGDEILGEYGVRNIPTLLFFKGGELVGRNVGSIEKSALKEKIDTLLLSE